MEDTNPHHFSTSTFPQTSYKIFSNDLGGGSDVFGRDSIYPFPQFTRRYDNEAPSLDLINKAWDLVFETPEFIPPLIPFTQPIECGVKRKFNDASELCVDEDLVNAMNLLHLTRDPYTDHALKQQEEQLKRMEQEESQVHEKMMVEKMKEFDQPQNKIEEGKVSQDGMELEVDEKLELSEPQLSVMNSLINEASLITKDPFPSPSEPDCRKDIPFVCSSTGTPTLSLTVGSCSNPSIPMVQAPTPNLKTSFSPTQSLKQRLVTFLKGPPSRKPCSMLSHPKHRDSLYASHMQIQGAPTSVSPYSPQLTLPHYSVKYIYQIENPVMRESAQRNAARCLPNFQWKVGKGNEPTELQGGFSSMDRPTKKTKFMKFSMFEKFKMRFKRTSSLFSSKNSSSSPLSSTSAGLNPFTPLLHYHETQVVHLSFLDIEIPSFLFVLWKYIDRDEILSRSGVFRMNSNTEKVLTFLEEYKVVALDKIQNEPLNPNYIFEPADILKKWLRENPSSIFPSHYNLTLQELSKSTLCEDTFLLLKNVIFTLDSLPQQVLKFILYLTHRVLKFSSLNSMNELSLARTIGPNLFSFTDMTSISSFDWYVFVCY
ncbi:hypothetical protein HMI55_004398 [Coelomomyces lativittatus]|nr:hypothetical protein HMI55_004398 [Coelomomyces lativittatus]